MWKLLVISLLTIAAHADQRGTVQERMEAEGQDDEACATAPGNPQSSADCRNGAKATDACLSDNTIKKFEAASRKGIAIVKKQAGSKASVGLPGRVVREGLMASGLIKADLHEFAVPFEVGAVLEKNSFVNLMNCPAWKEKLTRKNGDDIPNGAVLVYEKKPNEEYIKALVADGITKEDAEATAKARYATDGDIRMKTPYGCLGAAKGLTEYEKAGVEKGPRSFETLQLLNAKAAEEHVKKAKCLDNRGFNLVGIYVKNVN